MMFVPDIKSMQQLSQVNVCTRKNSLSSIVHQFWINHFLVELGKCNIRMCTSLNHMLPLVAMPYARMAENRGLIRSLCEWCCRQHVTDLSYPIGVSICQACTTILTWTPSPIFEAFMQDRGPPTVSTNDVFIKPHWPMVPKGSSLVEWMHKQHGLEFEGAEDKVKQLIKHLKLSVLIDLQIGMWTEVPTQQPMWGLLQKFNFETDDKNKLTNTVVNAMRQDALNLLASRKNRYNNLLLKHNFGLRKCKIIQTLLPINEFSVNTHTIDMIKNTLLVFEEQRNRFLQKQRRLPVCFRRLNKNKLLPPSSNWVELLCDLISEKVRPFIREVFNKDVTWTAVTLTASYSLLMEHRHTMLQSTSFAQVFMLTIDDKRLKRIYRNLGKCTLTALYNDLHLLYNYEEMNILSDEHLQRIGIQILQLRYKQFLDFKESNNFCDETERWSKDGEPMELWTFRDEVLIHISNKRQKI